MAGREVMERCRQKVTLWEEVSRPLLLYMSFGQIRWPDGRLSTSSTSAMSRNVALKAPGKDSGRGLYGFNGFDVIY